MDKSGLLTFIETPYFTEQLQSLLDDETYRQLQADLLIDPEKGSLIQGTGGVRKLRWKLENTGKRGGVRVIYFYADGYGRIYMLSIYAKANKETLSSDEKKAMKKMTTLLKQELRDG